MPTFPVLMLTSRCKPRTAAWCRGSAEQKENMKTFRTLTPMQLYVRQSHNIKEATFLCVYTIEWKWTMQMTFDLKRTPLTLPSLITINSYLLDAWLSIIGELEVCEAVDCMHTGGYSHVRHQDDTGSFGGGDDARGRGVGAKLDCLLRRGDDICCA